MFRKSPPGAKPHRQAAKVRHFAASDADCSNAELGSDLARLSGGPAPTPLTGSVEGGPAEAEQVCQFGGAVLAGVQQAHQVRLLAG